MPQSEQTPAEYSVTTRDTLVHRILRLVFRIIAAIAPSTLRQWLMEQIAKLPEPILFEVVSSAIIPRLSPVNRSVLLRRLFKDYATLAERVALVGMPLQAGSSTHQETALIHASVASVLSSIAQDPDTTLPRLRQEWLLAFLDRLPQHERIDVTRLALFSIESVKDRIQVAREALVSALPEEEKHHIPSLVPRISDIVNTSTYQNEHMTWDIGPGERVLDIGSGSWPFRLATHLADRYLGPTSHRMDALMRDERPFTVADIHSLPFADKSFDFIFCSHLLEHLDRPGDAIRELMRVGKRGYIETPSRLSDVMLNFTVLKDHHRWHTLRLGQILVMIEWLAEERRDIGTSVFFQFLHSRFENPFQTLVEQNWDMFFVQLHWVEQIDFLILDKSGKVIDGSGTLYHAPTA